MATFDPNKSYTGSANPLGSWFKASNWSATLGASIKEWVKKWQDTSKITQEQKTKDFFAKRQQITDNITTWKITSWSAAQDTLTIRKNNLVQLFAADALEKWANPDKVVAITKKPDEVLKRLTSLWEKQAKAVNDYLMKWWYADRVFDYAIGNTKSPDEVYKTKEEKEAEKNTLQKGMDWIKGTALGNFSTSALSVPFQSSANLLSLATNKWESKDLEEYSKFLSTVSTDEYNKYKNEWGVKKFFSKLTNTGLHDALEAPNYEEGNKTFVNAGYQSKADFYDWYDEAVKNWFSWSVEEYANYMNNMANKTIAWVDSAVKNFLEKEVYDPNKMSAKVGKMWWEALEMALFPELKLKWLTKAGTVWKAAKWLTNLAAEWAEFQALDDAYNKDLSDFWKYYTAVKWNTMLWWLLKWTSSYLSKLDPKKAEAVATKTTKEWEAMNKVTDAWNKNANQEVTPYTKIIDILDNAKQKLWENRIDSGKALEEARKNLTYWWEEYTAREVMKDMQNAFSKLKEEGVWGEQALIPEFDISKSWRTLKIKNKDVLNTITKWDSKQIKLWDEIENLWKEMFNTTDKAINAQTTDEFIRRVKGILWDEWWNWVSWEWLKTVRWALEGIDERFANSLSKDSAKAWKEARAASKEDIDLDKLFKETSDRLKYGTKVNSFSQPEVEQLFTKIKDATNIDLNNEIWAWVLNISLRDPQKAQKLLETIYPSQPWATEFIIKKFMNRAKRRWAVKYTKDYTKSVWEKMTDSLPWRIWATMFGWL